MAVLHQKATYMDHGKNCREYVQEVYIGGRNSMHLEKACRRDDGSWEIVQ